MNNSRVIPARLLGRRESQVDSRDLSRREIEDRFGKLVRPGGRLKRGARAIFGEGRLTAELLDEPGPELRRVRFHCEGSFHGVLAQIGSTPLPPYIKRPSGVSNEDRERYQTVYSKQRGAIAAPTAGLHFTPEVLEQVAKIASLAEITLHVGYGTFERSRRRRGHSVSSEHYEISEATARKINDARANGGRVIVVGTTTMRALESSANERGEVVAGRRGESHDQTGISISSRGCPADQLPPATFFAADPRQRLRGTRARAACLRPRRRCGLPLYSYGDCMLIL